MLPNAAEKAIIKHASNGPSFALKPACFNFKEKFLKLYSIQKHLLTNNSFHNWENSKSRIVLLRGIEKLRERLKSALYPNSKSAVFKICRGRFHEKLLFSNLRLLLTKMQNSSDLPLEVRIQRFIPDNTKGTSKKSKRPFGDKKNSKRSRTMPKKMKGGRFSLVRFCMLRLKSKKK